jgi:hypothetical protein
MWPLTSAGFSRCRKSPAPLITIMREEGRGRVRRGGPVQPGCRRRWLHAGRRWAAVPGGWQPRGVMDDGLPGDCAAHGGECGLPAVQATTARHDDVMSSRCRRTHRGRLLCYLVGALCGVALVLVPDEGGHVPVVLRRCCGKTAVCRNDLCCYFLERQCGHACIIAVTHRCGHGLAKSAARARAWMLDASVPGRGTPGRCDRHRIAPGARRFPSGSADLDHLARVPRPPLLGGRRVKKTSNIFLEFVVICKASRAGAC